MRQPRVPALRIAGDRLDPLSGEAIAVAIHHLEQRGIVEVEYRAIQRAGSLDPQRVRDAIAQTDMMTAYGRIKFNEKGVNVGKAMAVVQIQTGKPVVVSPLKGAQAKLVYPRR